MEFTMIESLQIKNFRCFPELTVSSIGRVNLIAGVNNVGKTALLEAIYLLGSPNLPAWPPPLNFLRGFDKLPLTVDLKTRWGWLFHRRFLGEPVSLHWQAQPDGDRYLQIKWIATGETSVQFGDEGSISSEENGAGLVVLDFTSTHRGEYTMSVTSNGFTRPDSKIPSTPLGVVSGSREKSFEDDARRLSELYVTGGSQQVLDALRVLEPRLSDLRVLYLAGVPMIYGEIGIGRPAPLSQMGEGISRILSLVLEIVRATGGIVLIDEVEHGLHHSVMSKIWKLIDHAAKQANVQVFATTHSWECIQAAHMAFDEDPTYDLRLYRLERTKDEIRIVQYDRETLGTSVDMNLEVR
jgi:hypothetical protein